MFYLAAAFIVMWVAVTGYVFLMSRRQRALEDELQTLEEIIAEKRGGGWRDRNPGSGCDV